MVSSAVRQEWEGREMSVPNIIVMLIDNLGYGDLGCYGSRQHRTPHIDQLAGEGMRLTSFYSCSGVCTPSRGSLMTGCYPRRVNLHIGGRGASVLMPVDPKGLHPDEITLARLLKDRGYATGCVGKWHLGDQPPFLPTRHGFDQFFGCPYSEDMVQSERMPERPPLPLMRDEEVVEAPVDRDCLTKRYTEEAIRFITENKDRPFFLYLPHAMPGSTNRPFASASFQGRSANGPYGDAVEELDWSCGEVMRVLKELDLDENTLVIWTSDNGAVGWNPPQGSNAPLRGWGYNTSEGGQRMPCIAHWPGRIPAGVVRDDLTTMMDILPTVAHLAGAQPPDDRVIDGQDIRPILFDEPDSGSAYDEVGFFYYHMQQLQAVRSGPWKLYLPLDEKLSNLRGIVEGCEPADAELYDVRNDLGETREVSAEYPEVVERLTALAEKAREDLGDWDREGANQREAGWVDDPRPQVLSVE
ncbi:MAG: sulfatase [Gemmatimonadetes bacterium]|nr:sulfatase [Gemmatimonadota bacterium]